MDTQLALLFKKQHHCITKDFLWLDNN